MVIDTLPVLVVSVDVERVFSVAWRVATHDRIGLRDEMMEMLMLLSYWWR